MLLLPFTLRYECVCVCVECRYPTWASVSPDKAEIGDGLPTAGMELLLTLLERRLVPSF